MGKYEPLARYLRAQKRDRVPMTFEQIERLIGHKLPASHRYRAWWSNNSFNSVMTKEWLEAGFRSEQVDLEGRKLVFRRIATHAPDELSDDWSDSSGRAAVSKRHPRFGALRGLVRIPPDVDLTEPADPEWADSVDNDRSASS